MPLPPPHTALRVRLAALTPVFLAAAMATALVTASPREASAQIAEMPKELERVGVKEHLDQPIPLDAMFRDHTGKPVRLGDFFDGKRPVLLTFAYHSCPVLCGMILNATTRTLGSVGWTAGKEFEIVTISIDPNETLERTAAKRASVLAQYGRGEAARGWHFLVGDKTNIDRVALATGFSYEYDARQNQFAHPSLIMMVKPKGQMARYLYGLEFDPSDVRLGLLEASEGRSISTVEQIILYCYHYDPQGGRYVLVATRVMQLGGVATAAVLGSTLTMFWLRERRKGGLLDKPGEFPGSGGPDRPDELSGSGGPRP